VVWVVPRANSHLGSCAHGVWITYTMPRPRSFFHTSPHLTFPSLLSFSLPLRTRSFIPLSARSSLSSLSPTLCSLLSSHFFLFLLCNFRTSTRGSEWTFSRAEEVLGSWSQDAVPSSRTRRPPPPPPHTHTHATTATPCVTTFSRFLTFFFFLFLSFVNTTHIEVRLERRT
jgi:hypothetical protein